jgi:hypothetical protein
LWLKKALHGSPTDTYTLSSAKITKDIIAIIPICIVSYHGNFNGISVQFFYGNFNIWKMEIWQFTRKKKPTIRAKMRGTLHTFWLLVCIVSLFCANGCSRLYGLSDVNYPGTAKFVILEDVPFSNLRQAIHEALDELGLKVPNELDQEEFDVFVIEAQGGAVGNVIVSDFPFHSIAYSELDIFSVGEACRCSPVCRKMMASL